MADRTAEARRDDGGHDPHRGRLRGLEKKRLVKKLRHARERDGKCEGRKSHSEANPDAVKLAKRLRRASPKTASA